MVEAPGDLAGQLDVRHLVLSDRDDIGAVDEDVGRLQHGVAEVPVGDRLVADVEISRLVLERRISLEPLLGDHHREEQVQLCVLLDMRLNEDRRLFWVEARGKPVEDHVVRVLPESRRCPRTRSSARASRPPCETSRTGLGVQSSSRAHRRSCRDASCRSDASQRGCDGACSSSPGLPSSTVSLLRSRTLSPTRNQNRTSGTTRRPSG